MTEIYDLTLGESPLILSQPHPGLKLSHGLDQRLTENALLLPDTDWHIPELYSQSAQALDATVLTAKYSRFVIDLNRDPSGTSLYPGQSVTELCPTGLFDETSLYLAGEEPEKAEIAARKEMFWDPYHTTLETQIKRIHDLFGYVLLYDCHSIRSVVPRFFEGRLPVLNIGTGNGSSAASSLMENITGSLSGCSFSHVFNGRFKGGYITRHYGDPAHNVHAIQMEIAQSSYMQEEHPFSYQNAKADVLKPTLHKILTTMVDWGQTTFSS